MTMSQRKHFPYNIVQTNSSNVKKILNPLSIHYKRLGDKVWSIGLIFLFIYLLMESFRVDSLLIIHKEIILE